VEAPEVKSGASGGSWRVERTDPREVSLVLVRGASTASDSAALRVDDAGAKCGYALHAIEVIGSAHLAAPWHEGRSAASTNTTIDSHPKGHRATPTASSDIATLERKREARDVPMVAEMEMIALALGRESRHDRNTPTHHEFPWWKRA
jgi:hypothetical protein